MKRQAVALLIAALLMGCSAEPPAQIKKDEEVVFFPTCASHSDEGGGHWDVEIRGWIFEPETESLKRAALLAVLERALGLGEGEASTELFEKRARWFLVDSERGKTIALRHEAGWWALPGSSELGHFGGTVRLDAGGSPGWRKFPAVMKKGDTRTFEAEVLFLAAEGVSVVSDIDDTIKVTEVRDRRAMMRNTFFKEYEPVAGMAELYGSLAEKGAAFHYVSTSPWQLYPALRDFLSAKGFPPGTFQMRDFALAHSEVLNLFESPETWKPAQIEALMTRFPKRRFILIGDSGERDPEIYGAIARKFPKQVVGVFIRQVTEGCPDFDRFAKAYQGVQADYMIFKDPADIREQALTLVK